MSEVGVLLLVVLVICIPISIWRARGVWDKAWKRYLWLLICVLPINLFFFPFYLFHLTWRVSKSWTISRRWFWRIAASIPVLNPVVLPFYLWRERGRRLRLVAAVTSLYAAAVVTVIGLLVSAESPAVLIEEGAMPAKAALDAERKFISGDAGTRPTLCVSLSGGGIRSAAFSLGVLKALHERGILADVKVISAVSGGTYTLSWLVLQPYYAASDPKGATEPVASTLTSMFDPAGPFEQYLQKQSRFVGNVEARWTVFWDATVTQFFIRSWVLVLGVPDVVTANATDARRLYREKIQQAFHAHPRFGPSGIEPTNLLHLEPAEWSLPTSLWIVQNVTFPDLRRFLSKLGGKLPYPVFNLTLNVRADRQFEGQLWPHTFELTPLSMGGPAVGYRAWPEGADKRLAAVESVNIAPAISGAAVSGYVQQGSSSPWSPWLVRALRIANIDLGYFVPNVFTPRPQSIYLSDGGHSDNLGLYALIRRRCERVLAVDAEEEKGARKGEYEFLALTTLQKALDLEGIGQIKMDGGFTPKSFEPAKPVLTGAIIYRDQSVPPVPLVYVKLALDRRAMSRLPQAVRDYASEHLPFPHDPTVEQQYTQDRFIAYRELGWNLTCNATALDSWSAGRAC
jgi:hypothetical protein